MWRCHCESTCILTLFLLRYDVATHLYYHTSSFSCSFSDALNQLISIYKLDRWVELQPEARFIQLRQFYLSINRDRFVEEQIPKYRLHRQTVVSVTDDLPNPIRNMKNQRPRNSPQRRGYYSDSC